MDINLHAITVDVWDLKMQGFLKPQAAWVDRCQKQVIMKGFDTVEDMVDFFNT